MKSIDAKVWQNFYCFWRENCLFTISESSLNLIEWFIGQGLAVDLEQKVSYVVIIKKNILFLFLNTSISKIIKQLIWSNKSYDYWNMYIYFLIMDIRKKKRIPTKYSLLRDFWKNSSLLKPNQHVRIIF